MAKETSRPAETPYTVVARRYRPQQFADLVGQEAVARALVNALESHRVAHAYLFTGSRGVGKTSAARILAKALNCIEGPTSTPCDRCSICQSISRGEDIDVLEIDGASNRGIDEIRAIRQNISTRPSRARTKIYIVDEVHMLTPPAFNALLKTLEEPPTHVKFIFATTEVQKIPITILSRCQRFDFAGIRSSQIVQCLQAIVRAEGVQAETAALQVVARRAGGSMRDAQSLLDQLLAFAGEQLTLDTVHQLLGTATDERVSTLAGVILAHDAKQTIQLLHRCVDEGLQLGELLDQLIEYWRGLMLLHCAGNEGLELSIPDGVRQQRQQQATQLSLDTILAGLDILTLSKARLRSSSHAQVLLEMALIRLCRLEELLALPQLLQALQASERSVPTAVAGRGVTEATGSVTPEKKTSIEVSNRLTDAHNGNSMPTSEQTVAPARFSPTELPTAWEQMRQRLPGIFASQLACANLPAIIGPNLLEIRFPSEYTGAYDFCNEPEKIARISQVIQSITGQGWQVRLSLQRSLDPEASSSERFPTAVLPLPANPSEAVDPRQVPMIQRAMDVLEAQLLRCDPHFGSRDRGEPA